MATDGYSTLEVRLRAVEAVQRRISVCDVAEAYGMDRTTVYRWVSRHRQDGENGLLRKSGSGRPRKLQGFGTEQFWDVILQPASHFGFETDLWTVGRVQQVVQEQGGVTLSKNTIWRRLREAELTYQKPERQYFEIDEEAREEWVHTEVPRIRKTVREFKAILYFQDEASISLRALLGKTWAPCGCTPTVQVTGKRGAISAQSAISSRGRLVFALHEGTIASDEVIHFLDQMLQYHKKRHLVVVMDQAPPHVSKKTQTFMASQQRLHVFYLPKYSPDWNPDEKVWNHLKNHELKAHRAKTTSELQSLAAHKLDKMSNNRRLLKGLFFRCCVADLFA